jgi:hypothetical protein
VVETYNVPGLTSWGSASMELWGWMDCLSGLHQMGNDDIPDVPIWGTGSGEHLIAVVSSIWHAGDFYPLPRLSHMGNDDIPRASIIREVTCTPHDIASAIHIVWSKHLLQGR